MREAQYYEPHEQGVKCRLCPKECIISEGKAGFCRVRHNQAGKLLVENYGAWSSYALDPIEKKPLYHFFPGSYIFSIGTWGCNFACKFCQNWQIAQRQPETVEMSPARAVEAAARLERSIGIAYTYSEPSVWFEYVLDTAKAAHQQGLKNVLVTNGSINPKPLSELLPHIDALNIDVKAFNQQFYRDICAGSLEHVKQTVEITAKEAHVEVTCLVVPGLNDSRDEIEAMVKWLARMDTKTPLHFSRYFPNYKLAAPATPLATLNMAYEIAKEYLDYVYIGNVGTEGINTLCPECGFVVIDRHRSIAHLGADNKCPQCGFKIYITGDVLY
jgi:pyruvate formate lyase activating enzyme